jgi:DNA repair protein RAD5
MDRVHRIGQMRPVRVIRFLMDDTIETRMMALQEAKSTLGKGSLQKLKQHEQRKVRVRCCVPFQV